MKKVIDICESKLIASLSNLIIAIKLIMLFDKTTRYFKFNGLYHVDLIEVYIFSLNDQITIFDY